MKNENNTFKQLQSFNHQIMSCSTFYHLEPRFTLFLLIQLSVIGINCYLNITTHLNIIVLQCLILIKFLLQSLFVQIQSMYMHIHINSIGLWQKISCSLHLFETVNTFLFYFATSRLCNIVMHILKLCETKDV